ncbi:MAG: NUDIX hydrolase [Patescibacteria group bacterium]|jgi:8-oxo-dGTP pyrophosphatase MutT (NUDIX family)
MENQADMQFQISVKGLFANAEGKLLMMQEDNGRWDFPGGRIQKGEDLIDCLKRECLEETGLQCKVVETQPSIVYSAIDQEGRARLMVFFKIHFDSLDFKPSEECTAIDFYSKAEIAKLPSCPQLQKLPNFLG